MKTITSKDFWPILFLCGVIISLLSCKTDIVDEKEDQDEDIEIVEETNLIFVDSFNQPGRLPNTKFWRPCRKGGSVWSRHNTQNFDLAFIEDGKMVLIAEKVDGVYRTGAVETIGLFDFKYGKVEISAKLVTTAGGGFPALWMMPVDNVFGGSPKSGEMDIMEQLGNEGSVYQTIHSNYRNNLGNQTPKPYCYVKYNRNEFNTYGVEWSSEEIIFSVNGKETLTYPNLHLADENEKIQWPFDHKFYLIMNYALGGEDSWPGKINDAELPARMEIDWITITEIEE